MAYVAQADLKGLIPDDWLAGAMDDDKDEAADSGVWDSVSAAVDGEIDGRIGGRFTVPVSPVPPVLTAAAKVIACWLLWKRYGTGDARNPWNDLVKDWRARLDRIGAGVEALTAPAPASSGKVFSETAKTYPNDGRLIS